MQTLSYAEIENAESTDIGKIALINFGGATLAIEGTLEECLVTAASCGMTTLDDEAPGGQRPITDCWGYNPYQPKTGAACGCRPGQQRDNCARCEGTGNVIDFDAIRARSLQA
jgi:hypothetical protein